MRRLWPLALALALLAVPGRARATTNMLADGHSMGLGLGGGSFAEGVSGKLFLGQGLAAQAAVGMWFARGLAANADVLLEMPQLWTNGTLALNWNAGLGAGVILGSPSAVAVNGVAGLSLQLKPFPIELTTEFRPTFILADLWGGMYFGGGGAIRYFF